MDRALALADAQWTRGVLAAVLGLALASGLPDLAAAGSGACELAPGLRALARLHVIVLQVLTGVS